MSRENSLATAFATLPATPGDEAIRELCRVALTAARTRPSDRKALDEALRRALEALAARLDIDAGEFEPRGCRTKADVHAVLVNAIKLAEVLSGGGSGLEGLQAFIVMYRAV